MDKLSRGVHQRQTDVKSRKTEFHFSEIHASVHGHRQCKDKRINKRMDECMDLDKRTVKHMGMDKCAWMPKEATLLPEDFH